MIIDFGGNMKRKVVQHGPSTLIISLPSNWIKQNNVRSGDELDVIEQDKTLVMESNSSTSIKSMTQNISSLEPFLVRTFLARIYQKGYDRAYLVHNDTVLLKTIQEKTLELIGYEIIEQNNKYCLIQSISSHIELDFDNSLRKAFVIAKQMLEIAIRSYEEKNISALRGLQIIDLEVNRLCYFCLRQINKAQHVGVEQAQQSHILYSNIEALEHLGDDMTRLGMLLSETDRINPEIVNMMQILLNQFESVYSYFYDSTTDKANKAHELFIKLHAFAGDFGKSKLSANELKAIHAIRSASGELYTLVISRLDFQKNIVKVRNIVTA